jgi:hypothetical protein
MEGEGPDPGAVSYGQYAGYCLPLVTFQSLGWSTIICAGSSTFAFGSRERLRCAFDERYSAIPNVEVQQSQVLHSISSCTPPACKGAHAPSSSGRFLRNKGYIGKFQGNPGTCPSRSNRAWTVPTAINQFYSSAKHKGVVSKCFRPPLK